jgi:hypothetical protein
MKLNAASIGAGSFVVAIRELNGRYRAKLLLNSGDADEHRVDLPASKIARICCKLADQKRSSLFTKTSFVRFPDALLLGNVLCRDL